MVTFKFLNSNNEVVKVPFGGLPGKNGLSFWAATKPHDATDECCVDKTQILGADERDIQLNDLVLYQDGKVGKVVEVLDGVVNTTFTGTDLSNTDLIMEEIAKKEQLKPEFANNISECVDTSKLYVLPDGFIYAYITTEIKKENYTNLVDTSNRSDDITSFDWVDSAEIGSSGIRASTAHKVSNTIPCVAGDIIRVRGFTDTADRVELLKLGTDGITLTTLTRQYLNTNSYFEVSEENGVYSFTILNTNCVAFRLAMDNSTNETQLVITKNQEITDEQYSIETTTTWGSTGLPFVPADYENRIVDIENQTDENVQSIASINERVAIIEGGLVESGIPDYWTEHLANKIETIKALQDMGGKDSFSFVVMTDIHYPSNLGKLSPTIAKEIMDKCDIKYALILGDVRNRGLHSTKEQCESEWAGLEAMFKPLSGRILQTQGNHDAGYGRGDYDGDGDEDTYAYEFTPAEMFNRVYRKAEMLNAHFDNSGTAYYVDDVSAKVRYILLNTHLNFDGNVGYSSYETVNGMAKHPSMWKYRYTQSQYDFLINDALNSIPSDDWGVVIGSHVPINQSGEMPEYQVMVGVLNAYNNKSTYTGEYAGVGYDTVSVNCDFSSSKGTLIAYHGGHTHQDKISTSCYPSGVLNFPIITTRCDGKEENISELKDERQAGTITEQSFDVFTVDKKERKIYATKIGAGSNREIGY